MICRECTVVKSYEGYLTASPLKCRSWGCDYCRPGRINQVKGLARAGRPNTFLTLTVNPKFGTSPDHRAQTLSRAWRLLRLRAMRRYHYKRLPFLAVFEKTKNGEPHLHLLLRCVWLDQRWISRQMATLIRAPIVDIRRIRGTRAAVRYVAKYIGKDLQPFKGVKRYWRSQDYELANPGAELPPLEKPFMIEIIRKNCDHWIAMQVARSFEVIETEGDLHTLRFRYRTRQEARHEPPPRFWEAAQ